ncbi:hypothetical protein FE784_23280 [Paenibacillus hemerocallicola]|uniref:Uncharacterized protein n=1 Tax=Paenibacillus hemerocallicola TaxID=1172614 RepID=A0A5C4T3Z4_9BACL|nr:hypothetical protein [Paenibacillus hemerocallicola]TNJ63802.1 hypothetical protein FE784_23280 [Paenibacillus hemerocallicola]
MANIAHGGRHKITRLAVWDMILWASAIPADLKWKICSYFLDDGIFLSDSWKKSSYIVHFGLDRRYDNGIDGGSPVNQSCLPTMPFLAV